MENRQTIRYANIDILFPSTILTLKNDLQTYRTHSSVSSKNIPTCIRTIQNARFHFGKNTY